MAIDDVNGKSVTDKLYIRATVPPEFKYRIIHQPSFLKITPDDIKKGYKEVKDGSIISITTNNPNGTQLSISCEENMIFTSVTITLEGGGHYELFPGNNIDIPVPYRGPTQSVIKLHYRFHLLTNLKAESYQWPIFIMASPV